MKKIILMLFVLATQLNYGQKTINLGDFDELKVFDQLNVTLIPANENKIVITGTNEENVETVNRNGLLKIRISLTKILEDNKDLKVTLYFKKLESIDANEGSMVYCKDTFKQISIDISAQEGARIEAELDVEKASVEAFSGGIINLSGKAVNQKVSINTGGIVKAKDLVTSQTTINISAGGNAEINAKTLVDAKVNAGGTIYIYGKPKQIKQQALAGGKITEK
jgi:hypothetical protein